MPLAMKRRPGAWAEGVAKRSRQLTQTVVDALAHAEALPENLRVLLKQALPVVLNANKVDRHAYENEVVGQAQQALTAVQTALQQKHAAAIAAQNAVVTPAENNKRVAAKKAAEAHLEATRTKLEADKAAKKAAEKTEEDTQEAISQAKKEEKVAQRDLQKHVDKKASLTNAVENEFVTVKTGTSATAPGKKAVQTLLALGKEFGFGTTLMHTLPITCKKAVEQRTEFENMVFMRMQALIDEHLATESQHISAFEAVFNEKAATTAAALTSGENAKAALAGAEAELAATHTANKEAAKEVSKADHFLRHIWEDMRQACDAQDDLASEVTNFKEAVWGAFNQQKEKEFEPEPVEEEEAAPEAAPEAAEAQAEAAPEAAA